MRGFQEKYSKAKDKFENLPELMRENLEERLKTISKELTGVGKENLENIKGAFENPQENEIEREQIVIERSEADKKRVLKTFAQVSSSSSFRNVILTVPQLSANKLFRLCLPF